MHFLDKISCIAKLDVCDFLHQLLRPRHKVPIQQQLLCAIQRGIAEHNKLLARQIRVHADRDRRLQIQIFSKRTCKVEMCNVIRMQSELLDQIRNHRMGCCFRADKFMNIGLGKYQILLLFGLRCPCIADGSFFLLLVQVIFHPDNPR